MEPKIIIEHSSLREASYRDADPLRGPAADETVNELQRVSEAVAETCQQLFTAVERRLVGAMPDELGLEFGVSVSAEGGLPFVTKLAGEATFTVSATWKKRAD